MLTYLNTNWITGTISKPTFVNQFENQMIKVPHSLGVNWSSITWAVSTTGAGSKDDETNTLIIEIVEPNLNDLITVIDLVRSLIKTKSITNGDYMVDTATPMKEGGNYVAFLNLTETWYMV